MRGLVLIVCALLTLATYAAAFALGRATAPACPSETHHDPQR